VQKVAQKEATDGVAEEEQMARKLLADFGSFGPAEASSGGARISTACELTAVAGDIELRAVVVQDRTIINDTLSGTGARPLRPHLPSFDHLCAAKRNCVCETFLRRSPELRCGMSGGALCR
jgi:hypothetical protein